MPKYQSQHAEGHSHPCLYYPAHCITHLATEAWQHIWHPLMFWDLQTPFTISGAMDLTQGTALTQGKPAADQVLLPIPRHLFSWQETQR